MPSIKMNVPHQLSQDEASSRLKGFLTKVRNRYEGQVSDVVENWVGDALQFAFSTFGMTIQGNLAVEQNEVRLEGQIPLRALMFKGKIEQTIRDEITKVLA